jgi:broad specificity phosphatase PhoE
MLYSIGTPDRLTSENPTLDPVNEPASPEAKGRSTRSKRPSRRFERISSPGEQERLRGWLDVPLDEQGLQEAQQTAARIAGHSIGTIYSSDLTRALQTSASVARVTGAPIIPSMDLRPWNLGSFAGQLVKELVPFLDLLKRHPEMPAPGGESWNQFYERYSRQLLTLMALSADSGKTIAAVTHVRNFLAAPTVVNGGDRNKIAVSGGPKTGSTFIIERINGQWSIGADA